MKEQRDQIDAMARDHEALTTESVDVITKLKEVGVSKKRYKKASKASFVVHCIEMYCAGRSRQLYSSGA